MGAHARGPALCWVHCQHYLVIFPFKRRIFWYHRRPMPLRQAVVTSIDCPSATRCADRRTDTTYHEPMWQYPAESWELVDTGQIKGYSFMDHSADLVMGDISWNCDEVSCGTNIKRLLRQLLFNILNHLIRKLLCLALPYGGRYQPARFNRPNAEALSMQAHCAIPTGRGMSWSK